MKAVLSKDAKKRSEIKALSVEIEACRQRIDDLKEKATTLRDQIEEEENETIMWNLWECEDEVLLELRETESKLHNLEKRLRLARQNRKGGSQ